MTSLRLKFIQQFRRHGRQYTYFRRPGFKRVPLPGLPGSSEFMAAYAEAMADQPAPVTGGREILPGTFNALALSYLNSASFRSLAASTQSVYRNLIDRLRIENGNSLVAKLERHHIVARMAERADKPESANVLRKVLRATMQHAIAIGMRKDDPTQGTKPIASKSADGFHSWSDDEIAQFEARHSIGAKARLALALLLYTGQRRSDVVRMGPRDIKNGLLHIKQVKTGAELRVPVLPDLQQIIAASPIGLTTFLVDELGTPYKAKYFGRRFREWCDAAELRHCTAHGLRKAAARLFAEAGCSEHEIAAWTGHASLREVRRYTKAVSQERLAMAAAQKSEGQSITMGPGERTETVNHRPICCQTCVKSMRWTPWDGEAPVADTAGVSKKATKERPLSNCDPPA
jgi:integrase